MASTIKPAGDTTKWYRWAQQIYVSVSVCTGEKNLSKYFIWVFCEFREYMRLYFWKMEKAIRYRMAFHVKSTKKIITGSLSVDTHTHVHTHGSHGPRKNDTFFTDYYYYRFWRDDAECWCCRNVSLFLWFYFLWARRAYSASMINVFDKLLRKTISILSPSTLTR